jgi:hypothetical protein
MILDVLDAIAATASTIEKENILRNNSHVPYLREVLELTYNTTHVYYMKSVPLGVSMGHPPVTIADALDLLRHISAREIRGSEASTALGKMLSAIPMGDAVVVQRIIGRDLRCSIGDKIINKVYPGLIPVTPYMGAKPFTKEAAKKLFKSGQCIESDVKMDGRYVNVIVNTDNTVQMVSRQGKPSFFDSDRLIYECIKVVDKLKAIYGMCQGCDGMVLNGELTMDGIDRYTSNGIIGSIVDITEKAGDGVDVTKLITKFYKEVGMTFEDAVNKITITVWDWLPLKAYNAGNADKGFDQIRRTRLADLEIAISKAETTRVRMIEYRYVKTFEEAMKHFAEVIANGGEGTILKTPDGVWVNSKPVYQIKCKLEITCDLMIVGFNEGEGKYVGQLGSLICQSIDGLIKAKPFAFSDPQRIVMWNNRAELLGKIVEVKANGMSHDVNGNWSLMHPIYKSTRTDKVVADSFDDIKKIQNMALGLEECI